MPDGRLPGLILAWSLTVCLIAVMIAATIAFVGWLV